MSKKLSELLADTVKKDNIKKKPTIISGIKVGVSKPINAIKIEDMNE